MVGAAEAFRLGLVNRVVPDDQLMISAEELAKQILQNSQRSG
ncbi:MAG: enoyl-CoA hydratase-related protein [Deltaproteobacteria bacterium]|nr:enoyl-CoA hydratase-related protein [Deltaproteobacteria bacterium]